MDMTDSDADEAGDIPVRIATAYKRQQNEIVNVQINDYCNDTRKGTGSPKTPRGTSSEQCHGAITAFSHKL